MTSTELSARDFLDALSTMAHLGTCGTLRVEDSGDRVSFFYLAHGAIQHLRGHSADFHLARALADAGAVDAHELEQALTTSASTGETLARCCRKLGSCNATALQKAQSTAAHDELADVLVWHGRYCVFLPGSPPVDVFDFEELDRPLNLDLQTVIEVAAHSAHALSALRKRFPNPSEIFRRTDHSSQSQATKVETRVLEAIDGQVNLLGVIKAAAIREHLALQALSTLLSANLIVARSGDELLQLARHCEQKGENEEAYRYYLHATAKGCPQLDLPKRTARVAELLGKREEAINRYLEFAQRCAAEELPEAGATAYRKVLELQPANAEALDGLLTSFETMGQPQVAIPIVKAAIEQLKLDSNRDALLRCWDAILRIDPEDVCAHRARAQLLLEVDDPVQAILVLEELAAIHIASERVDEAVAVLREVLDVDPQATDAHLQLATTLARSERHAEAVAEYMKLAETLAASPSQDGTNWQSLIDIYETVVRLDPQHVAARRWLASAYKEKAQVDEATKHYDDLVAVLQTSGQPSAELAEALQHLIELRADALTERVELGRVLAGLGRLAEASELLAGACEQCLRGRRFQEARRVALARLEVMPLDTDSYRMCARVAEIAKDHSWAHDTMLKGAQLAQLSGSYPEGIELVRKALEIRDTGQAHQLFAELLAATGEDQASAHELVSAARLHLRQQDYGRAREAAHEALVQAPNLEPARELLRLIDDSQPTGPGDLPAFDPNERPTITGGSLEVSITERPQNRFGSVVDATRKLRSLKVGPSEAATDPDQTPMSCIASASERLKALRLPATPAEPTAPQTSQTPSPGAASAVASNVGVPMAGKKQASAAERLRALRTSARSAPQSENPSAEPNPTETPEPAPEQLAATTMAAARKSAQGTTAADRLRKLRQGKGL